jgi:RND family efflux transporter MFP subunit
MKTIVFITLLTTLMSVAHISSAAIVGALVDGQVSGLTVKEGDSVSKGQLLLEVDARAQQARISQIKARLKMAELALKDAKLDFEAEKALFDQTVTAKRRYDAAVLVNERAATQVDVLRAELAEAQAKLDYHLIKAPYNAKLTKLWVQNGDTVFHENQKLFELEAR